LTQSRELEGGESRDYEHLRHDERDTERSE